MTETEVRAALIHIKRHIYSKSIKKYIDNLLIEMKSNTVLKPVQSEYKYAARLYQVTYDMPLYGQKKEV